MNLPIYTVDAFAEKIFRGNPAAVSPLENWLEDDLLQNIATENNLSETAFFVKRENYYEIRWFTPLVEVDLCGHATLAAAHILFNHLNYVDDQLLFKSRHSGILEVKRSGTVLTLNFPADHLAPAVAPENLFEGLGKTPIELWKGKTDYLLYFSSQGDIESLSPDFSILKNIDARGLIVTAPGIDCDFVSRFFAPAVGINEDPVTGSAHTSLVPFWAARLGKSTFKAQQLSSRSGKLECELLNDRVLISGEATTYLTGTIKIN